jgi:hypothetical protein
MTFKQNRSERIETAGHQTDGREKNNAVRIWEYGKGDAGILPKPWGRGTPGTRREKETGTGREGTEAEGGRRKPEA